LATNICADAGPYSTSGAPLSMSFRDRVGNLRVYTLDRVAGEVAEQLVVHEQIDEGVSPDDLEYRVKCVGLLDDEPWTWVDAGREGNAIRMFFPNDTFDRLPLSLDLENRSDRGAARYGGSVGPTESL
jgi:hypothetical protein